MTLQPHQPDTGSLPAKVQFAAALADASLLPKQYQRQPANVLVAIEYGDALGIKPMVAMNEINIINGTPSLSASLMQALARQAGHKVRVTGDTTSATCEIVRADDPDFTHRAVWDEKKARDAGLWGKGHWAKDPATMLKWRAISECVRFACSEVLGGLKYTPEEVREFAGGPETAPARHTVTQQRVGREDLIAQAQAAAEQPVDWIGRVQACETVDELRTVWAAANAAGALDDELRDLLTAAVSDLQQVDEQTGEVL